MPRLSAENREANQAIVNLLNTIATGMQATPAQVALAWLLAQKPWIAPIPGTRKLTRLDANLASTSLEMTSGLLGK